MLETPVNKSGVQTKSLFPVSDLMMKVWNPFTSTGEKGDPGCKRKDRTRPKHVIPLDHCCHLVGIKWYSQLWLNMHHKAYEAETVTQLCLL